MNADDKTSEFMAKVDVQKDKDRLKYTDLMYMKQAEEIAVVRSLRYRQRRNRCTALGVTLACGALGVYLYTIHAVKQETFLDDLDEPKKVIENPTFKS